MVIFSGCDKANSAECPDIETQGSGLNIILNIRARDDISIHNIIINRDNCIYDYRGDYSINGIDKKPSENINLKFGEEVSIRIWCKPLEVVFETNLGQCEYKF